MSRAAREGAAQQRAQDGRERLGLLLRAAVEATRDTFATWERGAPGFALQRHVEDAIARLQRAKARLILDALPADPAGRASAQRWARL